MIGLLRDKWKWKLAQALEWRWWQRYLARLPKAEYLAGKMAYWERMLEAAAVSPQAGQHLLDAGCGPAGLFILPMSAQVDALDPLLDQYQQVLPHFDPQDYPGVRFLSQPLETFEAAAPYDYVFCFNAINHVKDLKTCIQRLSAALKEGGMMVVSVDAHRHRMLKKIFQYLPGDVLHPHQHDVAEYCRLFLQENLVLLRSETLKKGLIFDHCLMVFEKKRG